ncbi:S-type anion channel SLAH1-like protein [Drosera capensis]
MAGIVPQSQEINLTSTNPSSSGNHHLFLAILNRSISSFLERFHAGYFRISLALGGQTLLWKSLLEPTRTSSNPFLSHVLDKLHHPIFLMVLWSFSLFILIIFSLLYMLKCLFYFDKVKAEFLHHIGVNYLFAPWISWLLLLQSTPFVPPRTTTYLILWWVFAVPVVVLDIKIYGQWFTHGKRFQLTAVANPTSQLSVIGNLVCAQAAMQTGWKESAVCLFSLGMVHYLVLFVTLYQRLSGSDVLPSLLTPVFFLFFAAPSVASLAWDSIVGNFDIASKMLFFLSLFLFASLTSIVQESDEELQRGLVVVLLPGDSPGHSFDGICTGGEGWRSRRHGPDPVIDVVPSHARAIRAHSTQGEYIASTSDCGQ